MTPAPFRNSREHLEAELGWLDRGLWLMVQRFHQHDAETGGQGWFLSRRQVESWLCASRDADREEIRALRQEVRAGREQLQARRQASVACGASLRLLQAADRLRLSPLEELALVVCLAAEVNVKYGKIYAYLQDDLTRRLPSLGFIENLAHECGVEGGLLRAASSALLRWRAIGGADGEAAGGHRITQGVQLDDAVCAFLLEEGGAPSGGDSSFEVRPDVARRLAAVAAAGDRKTLVQFHGPAAEDGRAVARCVAAALGLGLHQVDLCGTQRPDALAHAMLEALLRGAALFASGLDGMPDEPRAAAMLRAAKPLLAEGPRVVFLKMDGPWFPRDLAGGVTVVSFHLDMPGYPERLAQWANVAGQCGLAEEDVHGIASRYRLPLTEIHRVAEAARTEAELRVGPGTAVTPGDLASACRALSRATFGPLARLIEPKQSWRSLVLPEESMEYLREICAHVRHRARVLHDWGFEARLSMGRGLYVMFVGPSGTGKTLAAEVVAGDLGLELLRVDLSAVVSKYIGETEKNLQRVFEAAERTDAILFFDEADALFGKRSEVKDAHDRYANIEINFLLQRLEEFEGVVILATNFAQNIDDAFSRRIHLVVEFPFPTETSRLAIWRSHLPERTPVAADVDLRLLAKHFAIAGGNIRNVVLNAAFLAAESESPIGMDHLLRATRREYDKLGKPYHASELPAFHGVPATGAVL